jgi:RNA polymerase sigma-70 factor (ECF subfamily)
MSAMKDEPSADRLAEAAHALRGELLVHCYQMVGSVHEAQDLVQETMLRAWRAAERYDPSRGSMRTWLYRIATNVCLTFLRKTKGRPLPAGVGQPSSDPDEPFAPGFDVAWLQPLPDRLLAPDPANSVVDRSQVRLALVAALQLLPARQRAAIILRDVLALSAAEAADILDTSVPSVNSALQRARAQLKRVDLTAAAPADEPAVAEGVIDRYVDAFERADAAELARLVAADVILEMPPMLNWYVGRDRYRMFMERVFNTRGRDWRTVRTSANGQPAFAAYVAHDGAHRLHTLQVFTVAAGAVSRTTVYQDPKVFDLFELESQLER